MLRGAPSWGCTRPTTNIPIIDMLHHMPGNACRVDPGMYAECCLDQKLFYVVVSRSLRYELHEVKYIFGVIFVGGVTCRVFLPHPRLSMAFAKSWRIFRPSVAA